MNIQIRGQKLIIKREPRGRFSRFISNKHPHKSRKFHFCEVFCFRQKYCETRKPSPRLDPRLEFPIIYDKLEVYFIAKFIM